MKRVLILVLILLSLSVDAHAEMFKRGDYLKKNQWGALEDILNDCKAGNITTDECVLYGCYVLEAQEPSCPDRNNKAKLLPSKYRLDKKSVETGPYFFIYYIYQHESELSTKSLDTFKNTEWCEDSFINEIICNPKVDEAIQIFNKSNEFRDDFYSLLTYLSENKIISWESFHVCAMIEDNNAQKFNEKFKQFLDAHNLKRSRGRTFLLLNLYKKTKDSSNRKAINVLNFHYEYVNLWRKYGLLNDNSCYKNGFLVYGGSNEENKLYCDLINKKYELICNVNLFKKPINFANNKTLEVWLKHNGTNVPEYGSAPPIEFNEADGIEAARINLALDALEEHRIKDNISIQKTVIHELFHTIQQSYVDKKNNFYWYNEGINSGAFNIAFAESTATWASDYFYRDNDQYQKYYLTIFESIKYFFKNATEGNYNFTNHGFTNCDGYKLGFFWYYFNSIYTSDSIKKIFELLPSKTALNAISILVGGEKNTCNVFHNFGIKNLLVTKQCGIYPIEDKFSNISEYWSNIQILQIIENLLTTHNISQGQIINIKCQNMSALSTQFIKIAPDKGAFFENSLYIKFKANPFVQNSVITAWKEIDTNGNLSKNTRYSVDNIVSNGSFDSLFRYYTKKGINPLYFIIVMTNISLNYSSVDEILIEVTLDKPANLSNTISNAGQNYNNDIFSFFSKGVINNVKDFDSEIATLYAQYKSDTSNKFYGNQLYQKIVDLNLYMQTTLNQIHDLRYQYYLAKSEIVNSIMEGANSSSIKNQILKYCDFVKKMAKIIENNTNSIDVFNGWVVMYHVDNKLKTTKAPANWTQEEYAAFDKDANAAMKKISSAFSNSKYDYKYTNEQIKDSVSVPMVGMPAIEIPGPIVYPSPAPIIPGPFMVNFCPNIEKKLAAAVPVSHKFSDLIMEGFDFVADGKPYNSKKLLCISDTFSPLSLKYFSSIAVHAYHEDNMPPQPAVSNIKGYVSSLGFYMKVCKDHASDTNTTDAFFNTKDIMIGGASKRITETIVLLAEAIIKEMKNGKNDLYTALNKELALVPYKDEVLDLLEKQLKKDGYRE